MTEVSAYGQNYKPPTNTTDVQYGVLPPLIKNPKATKNFCYRIILVSALTSISGAGFIIYQGNQIHQILSQEVDAMEVRITKRVEALEPRVDKLDSRVRALEDRVVVIEKRVERLESAVEDYIITQRLNMERLQIN